MAGEEPIVVLEDGKNLVGTYRNLVLAVWGESPGAEPMRAIHESHLALLREHPCVGHLVLIHGMPKLPTPEARELAGEYNRQSNMSSVAIVLDGEGFWASAARGFLTTVLFFQRSKAPTDLFRTLDEALRWQDEVLAENAPDRQGAKAAILRLRERSAAAG